jgi:hypothetical protein
MQGWKKSCHMTRKKNTRILTFFELKLAKYAKKF